MGGQEGQVRRSKGGGMDAGVCGGERMQIREMKGGHEGLKGPRVQVVQEQEGIERELTHNHASFFLLPLLL